MISWYKGDMNALMFSSRAKNHSSIDTYKPVLGGAVDMREKDVVIYAYVQTRDSGFAPCYDNSVWTLACCKPEIRYSVGSRIAKRYDENCDVFVMGISSIRKHGKRVPIYIARVKEARCVSQYYSDYSDRKDSVYVKCGNEWLSKTDNPHLSECFKDESDGNGTMLARVDFSKKINCQRDLYYRRTDRENYVLISDANDFVHFNIDDGQRVDNDVLMEIVEKLAIAPRSFRRFHKNNTKKDLVGFVEFFESEKKRLEKVSIVPWDDDECCVTCVC